MVHIIFLFIFNLFANLEKKQPIIISFTTIDSRINFIKPMIESLLNQTLKPDNINLYISDEVGVLNKGINPKMIPDFIKIMVNEKNINLIYTKDIGPHTKLIPCLKENWGKDCVIITVDDDRIYPTNFVEALYKNYLEQNCVICYRANKIKFRNNNLLKIQKYRTWPKAREKDLFNFAKGVDGVLYKPEFFTQEVFNIDAIKQCCPKGDDVWFNFTRIIKKIPVFKIPEKLSISSVDIPNKIELFSTNIVDNDYQIIKTLKHLKKNNLL